MWNTGSHLQSTTPPSLLTFFCLLSSLRRSQWLAYILLLVTTSSTAIMALRSQAPSSLASMYKPSGIPPYPTPGYHYGPRHVGQSKTPPLAPLPSGVGPALHPGIEAVHGSPRHPVPYGLITDLQLPVPVGDLQAGLNGHMYKMPEIPESFSELSDLNLTQLSDMSENEDVLLRFFVMLPQLKIIASDKEDLVTNIVEMAKRNLMMEPQLEGKRQDVVNKFEQLTQLKSAFETKMQRQHDLSESCSLSTLQARLKVAAHQAEEDSEETAENFLEGRTDIDEFLTSFMEKRTVWCSLSQLRPTETTKTLFQHAESTLGTVDNKIQSSQKQKL
ncbi:vacuolar protein sorting-associated protein 37A isoform X5 [Corythoichthys intestinalis]|uniref:vacuolar protein sorting-associated protein 37A isoform X5 n=1 Tax=Corythoichthys intestinalis TaxID=161448 RepID=UPI0025A4EC7D|nr:vacuolar protein sorting-associated protein 37A isoform X5 [Corythoichthys intestinalis]